MLLAGATASVVYACDWWIDRAAAPYVTARIEAVPSAEVALVLGTAPRVAAGRKNRYFEYRLDAAAALYKAGKVKFLLVSGDNRQRTYDEPTEMKAGLVARGVPADAIYRDFAGVRTLDSVLRARTVFRQSRYIVVSQGFHNSRAVWLARAHGIEAFGFDAEDVPAAQAPHVWARQYVSAAFAVFDVLVGTEPRFAGPAIVIGEDPPN
ncbi:MAG: YdcF family protein [Rhodospirillales bacterium]|nr:MAG: YdcF family protein [Rhodospirillales bacterium]